MPPSAITGCRSLMRRGWPVRRDPRRLGRFLGKFLRDVVPGALASAIGTVLFAHYQLGYQAPRPAVEQAEPASAEMMAMVRDEHAAIMDYLKSQIAAERSRNSADDADSARAAAEAKAAADAKAPGQAIAAELATAHSVANQAAARAGRTKAPAVAAPPRAPLMIAQVRQPGTLAADDRVASDPDSLLAKTLGVKDHVVAATRHVVSAIEEAFASVGDRIAGVLPGGRQFGSS